VNLPEPQLIPGVRRTVVRDGESARGVGLLAYYREQPERLGRIASALSSFPTPATVEALAGELYRVESTNATRRYLTEVFGALTRLPHELWESKLSDMGLDTHFSPRRRKFDDVGLVTRAGSDHGAGGAAQRQQGFAAVRGRRSPDGRRRNQQLPSSG
jgi:hypothetical protein